MYLCRYTPFLNSIYENVYYVKALTDKKAFSLKHGQILRYRNKGQVAMEIKGIKKRYGKKQVLNDITFSAKEGECIGIIGGNGCGKSTLLNILAGVLSCDEGSFTYMGNELLGNTKLRSTIVGYVPQNTPLFEELSAMDNLRLWYTKAEIRRELSDGALKMLGIDSFIKTTVSKMSGGMKKRLAIGCSVAKKPKVLLLDEPSAALDLVCKESIYKYISEYKACGGTVIIATHDIMEFSLCDKLYILGGGTIMPYTYDGDNQRLITELVK